MVNLERHPNTGENINLSTENSPGTEQFLKTIKEIRDEVESTLKKTNETMKRKWNSKKKPEVERSSGDLVWVDAMHYNSGQPSKKLSAKRLGPFPIIQKVGKATYELKIPFTWKSIHPVVNELYLTSYVASIFEQQSQKSDNRITNPSNQTNVQEVEEILDSR